MVATNAAAEARSVLEPAAGSSTAVRHLLSLSGYGFSLTNPVPHVLFIIRYSLISPDWSQLCSSVLEW